MSRIRIAQTLKRLRKNAGYTAGEVGEKVGKSEKTISGWENDRGQPDADILMQLCDIYNVSDILAEFREDEKIASTGDDERDQLLLDINSAIRGMTSAELTRYYRTHTGSLRNPM
ncbi:MAG: XRE family transcriptional regulator [Clostridia bacterium]|nr:XRE family transcriptional regulator [Clostridia bacterium]